MPLHIAMDVRRVRDFGIGTYIRNLTRALSKLDSENRYTLVARPADLGEFEGLGPNFEIKACERTDSGFRHNLLMPRFFESIKAHLYHIPLNSVAWWMPRPYVLTIHDMSTLLFAGRKDFRHMLHEERYRRGAARAARAGRGPARRARCRSSSRRYRRLRGLRPAGRQVVRALVGRSPPCKGGA